MDIYFINGLIMFKYKFIIIQRTIYIKKKI